VFRLPSPASPKRTVLSLTPVAGCSGTGKRGCPGIAVTDGEILAGIFLRLRKMYAEEGGANPEQVLSMTWNYSTPHEPASEEVAMESNGKALADIIDPATGTVLVKKASSSARSLRDDGTTSAAAGFCR
jgi:formate dehydrogenase major subunit